MKETLQKLKSIEPTDETIRAIKMRVDERITEINTKRVPLASPYFPFSRKNSFFLVPLFAFSFLLLFGMYSGGVLEQTRLTVNLSQATNAHSKSQIMLAHLDTTSQNTLLAMSDPKAISKLSDAIHRTSSVLDTLELMGEAGKYSMEECLSDYHTYFEQLEDIEKKITNAPYPSTVDQVIARNDLLNQIAQAKEEAEERIGKYPEEK